MSLFEESASLVPLPLDALDGGANVSGQPLPGPDTSSGASRVDQLVGLVAAKAAHARGRSELQRLTDHDAMRCLADGGAMGRMAGELSAADALLRRVVDERAVLAVRLKDLNSKQSIAIEPACQADFGRLLLAAATSSVLLQTRRHDLAWASSFGETPSMWEGRLAPLTAAVEECHAYHAQLTARAQALAEYTAMRQRGAGQQQQQLGAECA
ncbi:hypothetical protein FOA52_003564 [Chlamydomonas sp. UWO 241]|nr:hypothetical protein FOA52_003564 [Chlamydomonas sp. UWO 241]